MTAPIAVQLYSVRDSLATDFAGTVARIAGMGYAGVETAGFPGTTAQAAGALFRELGLKVSSAHEPLPVGDKKNEVLDHMHALGADFIVAAYMPKERFTTPDDIKKVCDDLSAAHANAAAAGMRFAYHNHWWEYQEVAGRRAYEYMLDYLDPAFLFELDTYWIKVGGVDPASVITRLGKRAPLLHIKDGPGVQGEPMTAVGAGVMDVRAVIQAGKDTTEWLIVELDACATDMLTAVADSFTYLSKEGLGHGNR